MDETIKRMHGDRVSKIDCFAYRVTAAGADCTALTELDCMECPFYKSRERVAEEKKKNDERLIKVGLGYLVRRRKIYVKSK